MGFLNILLFITGVANIASGTPFEIRDASKDLGSHGGSRIFGGENAAPGTGNHMVALVYRFGRKNLSLNCGGSIVTTRHVLSAAHCIDTISLIPFILGVIGTHVWHDDEKTISFTHNAIHPKWNSRQIKYDVGFLFVRGEIPIGPNVAVIPIKIGHVGGGVASLVSGWGMDETQEVPNYLQVLATETLSPKDCSLILESLPAGVNYDPVIEICTWHSAGHGNCFGDSGSALYEKETGCQTGIVSWGIPCAIGPDIYTRISGVVDFIISVLGPNHEHFCL